MLLKEPPLFLRRKERGASKLRGWSCVLCIGLLLCGVKTGLSREMPAPSYIPGELLVRFKPGVPEERIRSWHSRLGVIQRRQFALTRIRRLQLPQGLPVDAAVALYRNNPDVDYAEPDYVRRALAFPLDPLINLQWALHNTNQALIGTFPPLGGKDTPLTIGADIDAPDAWDITTGDVLSPARVLSGASTGLRTPAGVYVDTVNDEIGVANSTGNSVTIYPRTADGDVAPLRTVSGPSTGLDGPAGVYVDTVNNEIGVVNRNGDSVTIYPRTADGDVPPLRIVTGLSTGLDEPTGVYVDTDNDEIGVANRNGDSVTIYLRTADGNVAPLRTVTGPSTGLDGPAGLYVDTINDEIGVANRSGNSVTIYPRTADGDVAPLRTVTGPSTRLSSPSGLYVDTVNTLNNEIGVVDITGNSVTLYPRAADGDVAPVSAVSGASTGLSAPVGVYGDTVNNEIGVTNSTSDSVTIYSHMGSGPETVIAVIDSGVDFAHPDLSANIWTNPGEDFWTDPQHQNPDDGNLIDDDMNGHVDDWKGWNFVGTQLATIDAQGNCNFTAEDPIGNNDPMDDYGHGTAVAGIIAAVGNNREGVSGVMWRAKLMPLKTLDAVGCGVVDDEIAAIEYAIQQGARIMVLSSGAFGYSQSERDALKAANAAGIVVVAAAGNNGSNNDHVPVYPASYNLPNIISVAASDFNDNLVSFSNYGSDSVDLAAPGDCVYSTMPTGLFALHTQTNFLCTSLAFNQDYDYNAGTSDAFDVANASGTSFAAAHVAGVAGLLLTQDPGLTPTHMKTILVSTVDPKASLNHKVAAGGRLNAYRALTRDTGSTFPGGTGGDAGCLGIRRHMGGPGSPGTAAATILSMTFPLLLASRRLRALLRFR